MKVRSGSTKPKYTNVALLKILHRKGGPKILRGRKKLEGKEGGTKAVRTKGYRKGGLDAKKERRTREGNRKLGKNKKQGGF